MLKYGFESMHMVKKKPVSCWGRLISWQEETGKKCKNHVYICLAHKRKKKRGGREESSHAS